MNKFGLAAALAAFAAFAAPASANVTTLVYSGFVSSGDGSPFSGLVGTITTPGVTFATDFGYNWHPFGLASFGSSSTGVLAVATAGNYTFTLNSDDGSRLFIDGGLVVDNGGQHSPTTVSGSTFLTAGSHPFRVNFFEDQGGPSGVDLILPNGVAISGVPEPATWAMMLLGFLGLGWAYRRRQAAGTA